MDTTLALLALGTGVVVLATAVITLILTLTNRKKVQEVHVMVNSQRKQLTSRVDQLADALEQAGVDVPPPSEHPPDEGN